MSRSGLTCRPWKTASSPVLPMTVISAAGIVATSPRRNLAAPARDAGWGNVVTYSPKVFMPLTKLCRDVCHYCTFARPPIEGRRAYLSLDEVLDIARAG